MAASNRDSEPREYRTFHTFIAIGMLVAAQVTLLLHSDTEPAHSALKSAGKTNGPVASKVFVPAAVKGIPSSPPSRAADVLEPIVLNSGPTDPVTATRQFYSAFDAIREGDQYLSQRSQGKIVEIISGKTQEGLTPTDWRVVYYDSEARFKAVEIRFSGLQITRLFEPGRFLELFSERARKPIPADLLKIDSDVARAIALRKTGLTEQIGTKAEYKLETGRDGMPVWKINYWTQIANRESHLGEIIVSAYDGRVVKNRVRTMPQLQAQASSKILPQNRF